MFIEGDIFKALIPLFPSTTPQVTPQVDEDRTGEILEYCKIPKSRKEIQEFLRIKDREYFRKKILNPLIKGHLLKLTIPDKPNSPKQKYYS